MLNAKQRSCGFVSIHQNYSIRTPLRVAQRTAFSSINLICFKLKLTSFTTDVTHSQKANDFTVESSGIVESNIFCRKLNENDDSAVIQRHTPTLIFLNVSASGPECRSFSLCSARSARSTSLRNFAITSSTLCCFSVTSAFSFRHLSSSDVTWLFSDVISSSCSSKRVFASRSLAMISTW